MTDKNIKQRVSLPEILFIALLSVAGAFLLQNRFALSGGPASDGTPAAPSLSATLQTGEETPALSEEELYNALYESLASRETETVFSCDCSDMLFDVFRSVLSDHPELFWLTGSGSLVKKTSGTAVTVEFRPEILIGPDEIAVRAERMEENAREVLALCMPGETLYDRLLLLHDLLVDRTDYDSEAAAVMLSGAETDDAGNQSSSAYGCLVNRRAVCSGYAAAFQLLAERLGASCRRVQGTDLRDGTPHEWNLLNPDGEWVHADITWDDPVFAGEPVEGYRSYDYFCVTTAEILRTHAVDDPDSLPSCTAEEYGYYRRIGCELDAYDPDAAAEIISKQLDGACIFLKFPDEETADDALDRLLSDKEIFGFPAVRELGLRSASGTVSEAGTVCIWLE